MKKILQMVLAILSITLFASCGGGGGDGITPDQLAALIQEGKTALTNGNAALAEDKFEKVLEHSPNNPDANFGLAFIALMRESNNFVNFLSAQNTDIFRNVDRLLLSPFLIKIPFKGNLIDIRKVFSDDEISVDPVNIEQIRLEIVSMIATIEMIKQYLEKVIAATAGNDAWQFVILEDWNDPAAGNFTIYRCDILMFSALINGLLGAMHFSVAYSPGNLVIETDEYGNVEVTGYSGDADGYYDDTNDDGFISLGEIAAQEGVPSSAGVLVSDGRNHLAKVVQSWRDMITRARDAFDSYIAGNVPNDHWNVTQDDKDAWQAYGKAYANDAIAAFTNGVTLTVRPEAIEDNPELADDPGADFSIKVNFAAFFNNLPNDLRNLPFRFVYDAYDELVLPESVTDALTDLSLFGLFPDGVTQDLWDDFLGQ